MLDSNQQLPTSKSTSPRSHRVLTRPFVLNHWHAECYRVKNRLRWATTEEIPLRKPKGKFPLFPLWNGGCAVFLQGFPLFWIVGGENSVWPSLILGSIQGQDVEVNHTYKHDSVHLDEHRSRWNKRSRACFLPQVVCLQRYEVWGSRGFYSIQTFDKRVWMLLVWLRSGSHKKDLIEILASQCFTPHLVKRQSLNSSYLSISWCEFVSVTFLKCTTQVAGRPLVPQISLAIDFLVPNWRETSANSHWSPASMWTKARLYRLRPLLIRSINGFEGGRPKKNKKTTQMMLFLVFPGE